MRYARTHPVGKEAWGWEKPGAVQWDTEGPPGAYMIRNQLSGKVMQSDPIRSWRLSAQWINLLFFFTRWTFNCCRCSKVDSSKSPWWPTMTAFNLLIAQFIERLLCCFLSCGRFTVVRSNCAVTNHCHSSNAYYVQCCMLNILTSILII